MTPAASRPRPKGMAARGIAPGPDTRTQIMTSFRYAGPTARAATIAAVLALMGAAPALAEEPDQGAAVVTPRGWAPPP